MIDVKELYDRCFADMAGGCAVLDNMEVCDNTCPFYKPQACKDWVRIKQGDRVMLYTPEEYERSFKDEEDSKPKAVYWHLKRVSRS